MKDLDLQGYPRIGGSLLLDCTKLVPHGKHRITTEELKKLINDSTDYAQQCSREDALKQSEKKLSDAELYIDQGKEHFEYFHEYSDPAYTPYDCMGVSHVKVAIDYYRIRLRQNTRMNKGWFYQKLLFLGAGLTERFDARFGGSISDVNQIKADLTSVVGYRDGKGRLTIYDSIKTREGTIDGGEWPNAVKNLEAAARNDKNRKGSPYICVFGFGRETGRRRLKKSNEGDLRSCNTELWHADFLWPFYTNFSYPEIGRAMYEVQGDRKTLSSYSKELHPDVIKAFRVECERFGLLDEDGRFHDPYKLVDFLTRKLEKEKSKRTPKRIPKKLSPAKEKLRQEKLERAKLIESWQYDEPPAETPKMTEEQLSQPGQLGPEDARQEIRV